MAAAEMKTADKMKNVIALTNHAISIYEQGEVAKFLATASVGGNVNVALIVSQMPVEEGKIVFGDFMMVKTKSNLDENPRFASIAITSKLEMAGFKGELESWTESGPFVEKINTIDFFRYNAYAGIHNVAVASVRKISDLPKKVSFARVGMEYVSLRSIGNIGSKGGVDGANVPDPIRKKFQSIMSVKVLSYMDDDGYPGVLPVMSCIFRSNGELRFKVSDYNKEVKKIKVPTKVALNVLTLDLLTYQIKGELLKFGKSLGIESGLVRVDEAYSSNPPFCGQRVV